MDDASTDDVQWLDHTADVGAELRAGGLEELFRAALEALVAVMMAHPPRTADGTRTLRLEASTLESLMVRWLEEWIFRIQSDRRVPVHADLEVQAAPPNGAAQAWRLTAAVRDAPLDPAAHGWRGEVKGATYHGLRVERGEQGWHARIVFDV